MKNQGNRIKMWFVGTHSSHSFSVVFSCEKKEHIAVEACSLNIKITTVFAILFYVRYFVKQ